MDKINYLKTLTILYVEDEELARKSLVRMLSRFFKNILVASDGLEGYKIFKKEQLVNNIDLIISDINMPKLNGIEMLEKIREDGHNVPIIYLTARTESKYLLKAIELNTSHYILKPVNIEDVITKIKDVCEKKYLEKLLEHKNRELEQYTSLIENVAIVYKIGEDKSISYINPLLKELFGFEDEKFLNKPINDFVDKSFDFSVFDKIWEDVNNGESWNGDIKFVDKKGEPFYVNSTIFQTNFENEVIYVSVGFLSTESVNKKREFHNNVIKTLKDNNIEKSKLKERFEREKRYSKSLNSNIMMLEEKLKNEQDRRITKIAYYQNELSELSVSIKRAKELILDKNNEIKFYKESLENIEKDKDFLFEENKKIESEFILANEEVKMLSRQLKQKEERIINLNFNLRDVESKYEKIIREK